jgi:hypothetical protein
VGSVAAGAIVNASAQAGMTQGERKYMQTTRMTPEPQRLRALERANEVRLARADLKRRIADGEASAAEVILACPWEASSWSVAELLMSQRRWGITRCRKFLARNQISEIKPIGKLTDRQRHLLAAQLQSCESVAVVLDAAMPPYDVASGHTLELVGA